MIHPFSRRRFLEYTAGLAAVPLLETGANAPSRAAVAAPSPFELEEKTIAQLAEGMRSGRYTARRLVQLYLRRIADLDRRGPALHHVLETNPDALAIADRLDAERRAGRVRGPLHGIPILVKDNIDTGDRMQTTAGSLALEGAPTGRDAFVIERLRAAGAVILGKASLSEWANFRSTRSSSGWCARGGQGKNPYMLDRNPCGSSSGSGGAAAASYCAAAVGTETDGSIVCPSNATSLVGIKPTLGLVSRAGIIPIAHSQDTAGPMARTVADAAILLAAMAGVDDRDPATAASAGKAADYTAALDPAGLQGARIGVARNRGFWRGNPGAQVIEDALAALKAQGAELVDPADIPHAGEYDDAEYEVLLYEFKADLNAYLERRAPPVAVRTLKDLIAFNQRNREREMRWFGQEIFESAEEKGSLTEAKYLEALAQCRRLSREEGIDAVMDQHRLDAIVAPTGGPPWTTDLVNGDHFVSGSSTPAAVSGYPSITVPAGYVFGLPVGLSFIGRAWSEATLIKLAYGFEQATKARRPPRFLPTLGGREP